MSIPRGTASDRPGPQLHLVRMTDAERAAALEGQAVEYGEAKARAGFWSRDVARERARREIADLVGSDPAKRGHAFFFGAEPDGRRVGWAWIGSVPGARRSPRRRWLFQITVDEALRGRGYGRALLSAVERHLAEEGVTELRFNVFRWNTVAIALYSSAGYEVLHDAPKNLEMRKMLIPR